MNDVFYPVSSPDVGDLEIRFITQAAASGWVSSIGEFVDRFEREFSSYCGVGCGVAMTNGTDALFMALKALGVRPGDEVIVPALTFVAVPAVVVHLGAEPVIADVHPDYWCLDPSAVARAITDRTRAIVAVHGYGHPVDMDPIMEMAGVRGIGVVEDCAQAHGAKYKGRTVGSIGDAGCFSFYGNKVITTGEGGMVVTDDVDLAERMRFLKDHAMDPNRRYFHSEVGYNCRMTNLQAALGCAQLQRIDELIRKRSQILKWYSDDLEGVSELTLNPAMPWADPVNWMVSAVLSDAGGRSRDELLEELRKSGIDTRPFFIPIDGLPPYEGFKVVGREDDRAPQASHLAKAGFNLPSSSRLSEGDVHFIARRVSELVAPQ